jgi:hypothetical protein
LSAVATSTTDNSIANGTALPVALTDGFEAAFIGGALVAAVGVVASLVLIRRSDLEEEIEAVPALDLAA